MTTTTASSVAIMSESLNACISPFKQEVSQDSRQYHTKSSAVNRRRQNRQRGGSNRPATAAEGAAPIATAVASSSPLEFLHHERRLGGGSSTEATQMTSEVKRWLSHLTPVLAAYDYDCKDIMELLRQCEFDSAKIQAAVDLICEERQGHEQSDWQTQRRGQKKPIQPSNVETGNAGGVDVRGARRVRRAGGGGVRNVQESGVVSSSLKQSNDTNRFRLPLRPVERSPSPQPPPPPLSAEICSVTEETKQLPTSAPHLGSWAKIVAGPVVPLEEPVAGFEDVSSPIVLDDAIRQQPDSSVSDVLNVTDQQVSQSNDSTIPVMMSPPSPAASSPVARPTPTLSEVPAVGLTGGPTTAAPNPPISFPALQPPAAPVTSPMVPSIAQDVVLPKSSNRSDDVVLPYALSRREVSNLKFGNLNDNVKSVVQPAAEIFFGGCSVIRPTTETSSRIEPPVAPPGLAAEPAALYSQAGQQASLHHVGRTSVMTSQDHQPEPNYNFPTAAATGAACTFAQQQMYEANLQQAYGWDRSSKTSGKQTYGVDGSSVDATAAGADGQHLLLHREIDGSFTHIGSHNRRGGNIKHANARRGGGGGSLGFYQNQQNYPRIPQYGYDGQYSWSNNFVPQSYNTSNRGGGFMGSELDAHAAAAAAVLKSQQQGYQGLVPVDNGPYDSHHNVRGDEGGYYSYGGGGINRRAAAAAGSNHVQSALSYNRTAPPAKHTGAPRRNSGGVTSSSTSSFSRGGGAYGAFNVERGGGYDCSSETPTINSRSANTSVNTPVPGAAFRQHVPQPQQTNLVLLGNGSQPGQLQNMGQPRSEYTTTSGGHYGAHSNYFYDNSGGPSVDYNSMLQQQHHMSHFSQRAGSNAADLDHVYGSMYGNSATYNTAQQQYSTTGGGIASRHL